MKAVNRAAHDVPAAAARLDPDSAEWLRVLSDAGPRRGRAILEVSAKLGRHFWRHPSVPLDAEDWDRLPDRFGFEPAREAEWQDLLAALRRAVDTELTPRQREVFVAIVLNEVPLDALAAQLGSNRNVREPAFCRLRTFRT